jgi:hypothetical protein
MDMSRLQFVLFDETGQCIIEGLAFYRVRVSDIVSAGRTLRFSSYGNSFQRPAVSSIFRLGVSYKSMMAL